MPGCAMESCGRRDHILPGPGMRFANGRWHCYLCYLMPRLFAQPPSAMDAIRAEANPTRDGSPKLAAEKKRNLIFEKRRRQGPHRGNA